ncbi:MAG: two-component system, NtrC family, response regulator AtoC [Blastocatellia bacterium]|jgi:DNA-binding NtrC family response regulator|nr:two-component system, NtrC family, response regulator AtoC [Blastocatellia bacterium]
MNRKIRVLVVDDDSLLRRLVTGQLARSGFEASSAANGQEALEVISATDYDVILLDIQMPGISGLDALRQIRKMEDAPEVIMLTADTSLATGIEAMRLGAYDYLTKPSPLDEMEAVIRKADEKRRLIRQNASLRAVVVRAPATDEENLPAIIYQSAAMQAIVAQAEAAARLDSTILITGESGTGKDVLVRLIHARSARGDSPIITINCGALPETLFESEFFGHERGAFTGASMLKRGLLEAADGSTLFLDEVGELPLQMQVKLLHFLEQGRFRRVGSTRDQRADVRVIAATNRNLVQDVRDGRFRADLFYRLNVVALHISPLRERPEDINELINHFLDLYRQRFNRPALDLSNEARRRLESYSWPGNVRELRNCLERAAALSATDIIEADQVLQSGDRGYGLELHLQGQPTASDAHTHSAPVTLEQLERQHILRVLDETGGNRDHAAAILGISARTLYRKIREYES